MERICEFFSEKTKKLVERTHKKCLFLLIWDTFKEVFLQMVCLNKGVCVNKRESRVADSLHLSLMLSLMLSGRVRDHVFSAG